MHKYLTGAAVLMMVFSLASCEKDKRLMYKEDPRVYFYDFQVERDSLYYTFATQAFDKVTDTAYLVVRIIGDAAGKDREVKLETMEGTTAVEGRDYDFGPLLVHAGKYEDTLQVYLHKTEAMNDSTFKLFLKIGESKDFKPGFTDERFGQSREYYKIYITNQLVQPSGWSTYMFGTFSKVKFQFMILATGKKDWDGPIFPAEANYIVQQTKQALVIYEQANGPLIDEFGNRVVFP